MYFLRESPAGNERLTPMHYLYHTSIKYSYLPLALDNINIASNRHQNVTLWETN